MINLNLFFGWILKVCYIFLLDIWFCEVEIFLRYVWYSIFSVRYIIEVGLRWRIGDGKEIKVWGDYCLLGDGGKIVLLCVILDLVLKVSNIFDYDNYCWREDVINDLLFWDVKKI